MVTSSNSSATVAAPAAIYPGTFFHALTKRCHGGAIHSDPEGPAEGLALLRLLEAPRRREPGAGAPAQPRSPTGCRPVDPEAFPGDVPRHPYQTGDR